MKNFKIVLVSPKGYIFHKWVFDFKIYGELMWFLRIFGVMIQYCNITERVVVHPITGSKHTVFSPFKDKP